MPKLWVPNSTAPDKYQIERFKNKAGWTKLLNLLKSLEIMVKQICKPVCRVAESTTDAQRVCEPEEYVGSKIERCVQAAIKWAWVKIKYDKYTEEWTAI